MRTFTAIIPLVLSLVFASACSKPGPVVGQEDSHTAADGNDLGFSRYAADGDTLLLWIGSGYGLHQRARDTAAATAAIGIEVWQIDLADTLFLPRSTEQMRAFTGNYVAELAQEAHKRTGKKVVLTTRAYGAIPVLRGARKLQQKHPGADWFSGVVLFSPDLYQTMPSLGQDPEYVPIVSATNMPVVVFQDGKRGTRWYVDRVVKQLESGGARTQLHIFEGVAALFFDDDDRNETRDVLPTLPGRIKRAIDWLQSSPAPREAAVQKREFRPTGSGLDHRLKPYRGKVVPTALKLADYQGHVYTRGDFRGQVTVLNFWATWCPPCVKEIPALNTLKAKMRGKNFELISINYMEKPERIKEFMKQVDVEFPVLMDDSGEVSAQWKVIAFPSTYIIGPDGKIHYGVNAAIHWDSDEVVKAMEELAGVRPPAGQ